MEKEASVLREVKRAFYMKVTSRIAPSSGELKAPVPLRRHAQSFYPIKISQWLHITC